MRTTNELKYTTVPYEHQRGCLKIMWAHPEFALFLEMGTGKSKIIIDEIYNLTERDLINCVIVVAPNGVHENWREQFELHMPQYYEKIAVQVFKSSNNAAKQEKLTRDIIASGKVLVFLINVEALSVKKGQDYVYRILRARSRTYFVIDESHKIKAYNTIRTKQCIALGKLARYRRIATGTESQEGLINLYSQFKFLNTEIIGHRGITSFKAMYCIMGGYEGREILGYQNKEFLAARIAPYIYQKRKKECLDLPDKVFVEHHIDFTPEQTKIYDELEEQLLYEIDSQTIVDVTMVLPRLVKLQQVSCGHLTGGDKRILIPNNRAAYVAELIEQASGKVIVFCRFVADVDLVLAECAKLSISAVGIIGETSNRIDRINLWRRESKVLAITTATGGTGLTLNEANTTIFYSNSYSSTDRLQAEDRNHRIGQEQKVTYHDITTKGKIDHAILKVLKNKQDFADKFRGLLAQGKAKAAYDFMHED